MRGAWEALGRMLHVHVAHGRPEKGQTWMGGSACKLVCAACAICGCGLVGGRLEHRRLELPYFFIVPLLSTLGSTLASFIFLSFFPPRVGGSQCVRAVGTSSSCS